MTHFDKAERCVEALIFGNVTYAKQKAKRIGNRTLRQAGQELGLSLAKATAAADFLKGELDFQSYCDAE